MGKATWKSIRRAGPACLLLLLFLGHSLPAMSAEYPRRVAIAPFASLAKEDIQQTVSVLPRLLSSRLMALAGAEVVLLPAGEKPPAGQAKGAGMPLLLQGTVAKLGKGYSIDVTATEVESGKVAGAFFASAASEDEIIHELGVMSGEIVEKLFGVKVVRAPAASPPQATLPQPPPPSAPATGATFFPLPVPAGSAPGIPAPGQPVAAAPGKWSPSALRKVSESGKIPDEIHGVTAGDVDADGNGEVIAHGKSTIYIYRVKGADVVPYTRITKGLPDHILNVEAVDLDADGKKEILVSGIEGDDIRSTVLKRKGEVYEKIASRIPYHLVVLSDWNGKTVVAGQEAGSDLPFRGKFYLMSWNGKTVERGAPLPPETGVSPLSSGILGLASARFGEGSKFLYTDPDNHLRVLDPSGKTEYMTERRFGWSDNFFEYGIYMPRTGKTRYVIRKGPRVVAGPDARPMVLAPEDEGGLIRLETSGKTTRIVLLAWDNGEFVEKAGTAKGDRVISGVDILSMDRLRKGERVVASVIEKSDSTIRGGVSRLLLYVLD